MCDILCLTYAPVQVLRTWVLNPKQFKGLLLLVASGVLGITDFVASLWVPTKRSSGVICLSGETYNQALTQTV